MIEMTAGEIAQALGGRLVSGAAETRVPGPAIIDSRQAAPGVLFVAFAGENVDGADFAAGATSAGAAAVLAERELPGISAPVIVVDNVQDSLGELA
ncbi:MAG: Mur ligase domain-containing protein, partial [Cellulomonadaceae bacterium]|nr:Mur ligase domain-containing protein [Cellulomonadaceae bacterium]